MEVKSGMGDSIKINEPTIEELKQIPVGGCARRAYNARFADMTLKGDVTYCHTEEGKWEMDAKLKMDNDEIGEFHSVLTIDSNDRKILL